MNSYLNFDGKIIPSSNKITSAKNQVLQIGLFETMRFSNGKIKNFNDHFERLSKGISLLKIKTPGNFSNEFFKNEIEKLIAKCDYKNARLRLSLIEIKNNSDDYETVFIIEAFDLPSFPQAINITFTASIFSEIPLTISKFSTLKTNNRLPYQLAHKFAFENNIDDAFLLNQYGRICESTIANIFIIKNQTVFTPHLNEGCIDGIMRKNIIKVLLNSGYEIKEEKIEIEDLNRADEIFISNSILNMKNIFCFNGRNLENKFSKVLFNEINNNSDLFL